MERKQASDFPPEVLKLFDGYVHGWISPPRVPRRRRQVRRGRLHRRRDAREPAPQLRVRAAGREGRPAHRHRVRHLSVAAGIGHDARLSRAAGGGFGQSCPASSSSTRIAASIRTSRTSRAGSAAAASSRSRPMGSRRSAAIRATRRRRRSCFAQLDPPSGPRTSSPPPSYLKTRPDANGKRRRRRLLLRRHDGQHRWPCACPISPPRCRSTAAQPSAADVAKIKAPLLHPLRGARRRASTPGGPRTRRR